MYPKCICGATEKMFCERYQRLQLIEEEGEVHLIEVSFVCPVCSGKRVVSFRCIDPIDA